MARNRNRNKPRLQIALYTHPPHRGTYRYALFIAPKNTHPKGKTFHPFTKISIVHGQMQGEKMYSRYKAVSLPDLAREVERGLLVLVTVGKVQGDVDEVARYLWEEVGVGQDGYEDGEGNGSAVECTRNMVEGLAMRGLATMAGPWDYLRECGVLWLEGRRMKGRWEEGWKGKAGVPTYDAKTGKQSVS